ncbi:unnamed protein product [Lactuca saligna]|uniref:Uncharacterized protein n=1 Tax=Lactuca saligna TaxID=75948 RepID=A0AA35YTF7_LACSI|nr:unnamed protein product [Lactuca saligna]
MKPLIIYYMCTGSYNYESMTLFVYFQKYPSVPQTCAYLFSLGNDVLIYLKDAKYCMENAFITYLVRLQIETSGKGNATWVLVFKEPLRSDVQPGTQHAYDFPRIMHNIQLKKLMNTYSDKHELVVEQGYNVVLPKKLKTRNWYLTS